jgi:hypothetical protein
LSDSSSRRKRHRAGGTLANYRLSVALPQGGKDGRLQVHKLLPRSWNGLASYQRVRNLDLPSKKWTGLSCF